MKILVAVKRVVDYNVNVRPRSDGSGPDIDNVKMSMNPFDEIAVEQAVRMKEAEQASEIIAVSMGVKSCQDTLRTAMAMGADRSILVETDQGLQPLAAAKLLQKIAEQEQVDLILLGKQAIDDDANQTPQMLAALLNWPQATFASAIEHQQGSLIVDREVDEGIRVDQVNLPAVVSVDLRLNEPRFVKLPNIMKAKKKPLVITTPDELGVDISPRLQYSQFREPPVREAGIKVTSVDELVDKLRNEAKVI